jgi:hypothetical protein
MGSFSDELSSICRLRYGERERVERRRQKGRVREDILNSRRMTLYIYFDLSAAVRRIGLIVKKFGLKSTENVSFHSLQVNTVFTTI